MKKEKAIKELKSNSRRRLRISPQESLKRMKNFWKRKEQFLANARKGESGSLYS